MMRTNLIATIALMVSSTTFAQVGINNNDPKATLDVTAKTTDGSKPEGIIAPRLTGAQIQLADTKYGTDQTGTLVYATSAVPTTPAPTSKFSNITGPGYYYFDGSVWQKVGAGGGSTAGDTTNDAWINDATNKIVKLGTKSDGSTARDAGTDFVANDNGNVGIGTASPDNYALLDINSNNKGMLAPRVSLATNTTDLNSDGDNNVANQPAGLLVYNTGTSTLKYVGYMFWNGTEWRTLDNSSTSNGTIDGITCDAVSLSPNTYTLGQAYSGTLSIPYTGGNGGTYPAQTVISTGVTGLTAKLIGGNFAVGSGTLQYSVTGTPSASSPSTTTFPVNIGGQTCNAVVGQGIKLTVGQSYGVAVKVPGYFAGNYRDNGSGGPASSTGGATKTRMANNNNGNTSTTTISQVTLSEFLTSSGKDPNTILPIISGLRLDIMYKKSGAFAPLFYNTTSSPVVISHASLSTVDAQYNAVFTRLNAGAYSYYVDGDDTFGASSDLDEFDFTNLTFPNTGEWYQITWHSYRDKIAINSTSTQYFYFSITRLN